MQTKQPGTMDCRPEGGVEAGAVSSMICPSCGGEWESDYCPECGRTIPTREEYGDTGPEGHERGRLDLPLAGAYGRPTRARVMNTAAFVTWFVGSLVLSGILIGLGFVFIEERMAEAAILSFVFAFISAAVVSVVVMAIFIHRLWSSIQDGRAPTTPGAAVGLCFVPIYNLYWVFRVFPGFVTAYNAYIRRHGISVPPLSGGIYQAYAVFCVLGVIPVVNWFSGPIALIVAGFMLADGCRAVNALAAAPIQDIAPPGDPMSDHGFETPRPVDRARESNTLLGIFAIIVSFQYLFWMSMRWLEVSYYEYRLLFVVAGSLFACVPLVMAFFVRRLGLKIAALVIGLIPIVRAVWQIVDMYG